MMQSFIAYPPSQRVAAKRLIEYCRDLDGTEIIPVPVDDSKNLVSFPGNDLACRMAYSLRCAAKVAQGQPFFWLEADSIPIRKGWLRIVSDEYDRLGKPFMISSDVNTPFDIVGRIGCYPGNTAEIVPKDFEKDGWDMFLIEKMSHAVSRTPLIQHRYGEYGDDGRVKHLLRFPMDIGRLRPDAVIFHRDKHQDLIGMRDGITDLIDQKSALRRRMERNCFAHSGDLGDIIAALPSVRQAGGGDFIITDAPPNTVREGMRGKRYEFIAPLLRAQPYMKEVGFEGRPNRDITHDFRQFRSHCLDPAECLSRWQARCVGISDLNLEPWLTIETSSRAIGRVVVTRSLRYRNANFSWKKVAEKFGERIVFIGLDEEYHQFQTEAETVAERFYVDDALEMASIIRGADLIVCNQSFPYWLAAGMGTPLIQETSNVPNSMIARANARYIRDGNI